MEVKNDMTMNGAILLDAHRLINGARQGEYGNPVAGLRRIASRWSAYLGREISGHDVACMMALLKIARQAHKRRPDNLLYAVGYIGLARGYGRQCERRLHCP